MSSSKLDTAQLDPYLSLLVIYGRIPRQMALELTPEQRDSILILMPSIRQNIVTLTKAKMLSKKDAEILFKAQSIIFQNLYIYAFPLPFTDKQIDRIIELQPLLIHKLISLRKALELTDSEYENLIKNLLDIVDEISDVNDATPPPQIVNLLDESKISKEELPLPHAAKSPFN